MVVSPCTALRSAYAHASASRASTWSLSRHGCAAHLLCGYSCTRSGAAGQGGKRSITSGVRFLHTTLSHREGYEARWRGLEAMPLDQYIEGGHRKRASGVEIRPVPMHALLQA